jgi:WD40 repeat protein
MANRSDLRSAADIEVSLESVRHVVPSSTGNRVIFAAFKHDVEVWDLGTRRMVGTFATGFDFGGRRLALSDTADLLLAGAYSDAGLTAHTTDTGEIRWIRRELRKVQVLFSSADGERLYCGREGFPCEVLSIATGVTLERIRGTKWVLDSPWEAVSLFERFRPLVRDAAGRKRFHIARETFAMLDAVFAPGRLVISESGGSVRCVCSSDGREQWRYRPHEGHHVLSLTYRPDDDAVIGVEWPYVHGGSSTMLSWNGMTGACTRRIDLGPDVSVAHGFCQRGMSLVTPTRRVLSTVDGTLRVALA